jgi:starch synthase
MWYWRLVARCGVNRPCVYLCCKSLWLCQVGGLGDVVTSLGRAVQEEGHKVEIILPKYDCMNYEQVC